MNITFINKILILILISTLPTFAAVVTQKIVLGELSHTQNFNGTLSYNQKSNLASESEGIITKLNFDEGDYVKKGQTLLQIDSQILDANIRSTKASIKQLGFSLERAKIDFKRYEILLKKQSVSQQKYDEFYFAKKSLEQELLALKSQLQAQKIAKSKKQLKAPFSGYISSRLVEVGEWLKQGSEIAVLINTNKVDITIHLPSSYINSLSKDKTLSVTINNKEYKAKVLSVLLSGNAKTRTFPIKLRLLKTSDRFFDGMQVRIRLNKSNQQNVLLVSRDALIKRFGKEVIFIVKDNKAVMIPVTVIGFESTRVALSAKGLSAGDDVIIKGNERIRPNQEIKK